MIAIPRAAGRPISVLLLSALAAACASTGSQDHSADHSATATATASTILTLEDARGRVAARETVTLLRLPLAALDTKAVSEVQWSQIETRATSDWSAAPVAIDDREGVAVIAGERGVELVATRPRVESLGRVETDHAVASVSVASNGLVAALSDDGATLHLLKLQDRTLVYEGAFPLDLVLGSGSRAVAALLSPSGETLAILDAGRSRVSMMRVAASAGSLGLEVTRHTRTATGLVAGLWTPDGDSLVVVERLLNEAKLDGVTVVTASGRLSLIDAADGTLHHVTLPGRPHAIARTTDGTRLAVLLDDAVGSDLVLLSCQPGRATILDVQPVGGPAAAVAFDRLARRVLIARPDLGALAVWAVEGDTLTDLDTVIDTGPGVSAVAVVSD